MNHSLLVIRTLAGVRVRRRRGTWRTPLAGDTPLAYVERMMAVSWRIRDRVPGMHPAARETILTLGPVRRMLRDERRRALSAADSYAAELGIGHE